MMVELAKKCQGKTQAFRDKQIFIHKLQPLYNFQSLKFLQV